MPSNDEKKITPRVNKLATRVQDLMDTLYQKNYYSQSKNKSDLSLIRNNMKKSIDNIIDNNVNNVGVPNISKIYSRLEKEQSDPKTKRDVEAIFSDESFTNQMTAAYMANKYLTDLDNEIDIICKYLPKLEEAIETRKDNVLSADHFTKNFITVYNPDRVAVDDSQFTDRMDYIKEKYDLQNTIERAYYKASKYGEQFIYLVPYDKALKRLLANKSNITKPVRESCTINFESDQVISESSDPFKMNSADFLSEAVLAKVKDLKFNLELSNSFMIDESVEMMYKAKKKMQAINEYALTESTIETETNVGEHKPKKSFDKTIDDSLTLDGFDGVSGQELLIGVDKKDSEKVSVPGCIQKLVDRSMIIPIYVDGNICMGYYYMEVVHGKEGFILNNRATSGMMSSSSTDKNMVSPQAMADDTQEQVLKFMSNQISQAIDSKFINMNQDLTKEIYAILKTNDMYGLMDSNGGMRVTFIPPEDMVHIYFDMDDKTHRGISDLAKALLPAKLYTGLYITNTIASMTRGQDKRVYYVKQSIDTNISKNLLSTINQIKKANFGIRQIDSAIESVLNITGRFNDYIIPVGPSGDSPIQFEVMPGQNIDVKTDLMNILEELAISATDVPLEAIQARQSIDYAIQLTMTNSRFLRKVYNRQAKCNKIFSQWITKLYNSEYKDNKKIIVMLPPPMFLNITNVNQVFTNTNDYVNSIVEMEMADETDTIKKALFRRSLLRHYLGTYLDISTIDEMVKQAERETAIKKDEVATIKNKDEVE